VVGPNGNGLAVKMFVTMRYSIGSKSTARAYSSTTAPVT
jgi:hypothetical protein